MPISWWWLSFFFLFHQKNHHNCANLLFWSHFLVPLNLLWFLFFNVKKYKQVEVVPDLSLTVLFFMYFLSDSIDFGERRKVSTWFCLSHHTHYPGSSCCSFHLYLHPHTHASFPFLSPPLLHKCLSWLCLNFTGESFDRYCPWRGSLCLTHERLRVVVVGGGRRGVEEVFHKGLGSDRGERERRVKSY